MNCAPTGNANAATNANLGLIRMRMTPPGTITAEAEVTSVHATKPVTGLRVRVQRQDGEVVLDGEAFCYTMKA